MGPAVFLSAIELALERAPAFVAEIPALIHLRFADVIRGQRGDLLRSLQHGRARRLHYWVATPSFDGGFMNKDQVKGAVKDIAGKAQQKAGELTGSEKQQIKGLKNQVEGKVQKGFGDVKEAVDDANEATKP
jgi:uncharacterized protein YjbJ (UPF0337 family)